MLPQDSVLTSYRIEISGWDQNEDFFVEKTHLDWGEETGKRVRLRHALRERAMVFVRLIAPSASAQTCLIANQVEKIRPLSTPSGTWEVHLVQLHPRTSSLCSREEETMLVRGEQN